MFVKTLILSFAILASASAEVLLAEQKIIVDKHNALRRQVAKGLEKRGKPGPQPSASSMRQMVWDADLAKAAQNLADGGYFGEDLAIPAGKWGYSYGTNIAIISVSAGTWSDVIAMWYNEVINFNNANVGNYHLYSDPDYAPLKHYSQVVYDNSYAVGCGYNFFTYNAAVPDLQYHIYVCKYGPAGITVDIEELPGQPIYKIGPAATACSSGTKPNDGLCA